MKFDMNIWRDRRDVSKIRTSCLIDILAKNTAWSSLLGGVAGACLAFAILGGTRSTDSWQWLVFGGMTIFGLGVGIISDCQLRNIIKKRVANMEGEVPNQASEATSEPAPSAASSSPQG